MANQEPCVGDLLIEERLDGELRRHVRMACLFNFDTVIHSDALPELLDVRLMAITPQAFTLGGFEREVGVECEQSCLVPECTRGRKE